MTVLTSLKALLFSSTGKATAATSPAAPAGSADFAALLDGSIAEAEPPGAGSIGNPTIDTPPIAEASIPDAPVAAALPEQTAGPPAEAQHAPGLGVAVAAGKTAGQPASMPPGLALGLARRAAAIVPAESPVDDETSSVAEAPNVPASGKNLPEAGADTPTDAVQPEPVKAAKNPHGAHGREAAAPEAAPVDLPMVDTDDSAGDQQAEPEADKRKEPVVVSATDAVTQNLPLMAVTLTAAPQPQSLAAPDLSPLPIGSVGRPTPLPSEQRRGEGKDDKVPTADLAATPAAPIAMAGAGPADGKVGPAPAAVEKQEEMPAAGSVDRAAPPAMDNGAPDMPAPQPAKSEALALLQLVREQVGARQSGGETRVGEQVAAFVSRRPQGRAEPVDAPNAASAASSVADLPQAAVTPSPSAALQPGVAAPVPSVDLSASLGAQMVDMGVSGQWIDGLARDIAGLSAHGAQGRFQINADQLGPVQVDIRQGSDGAAVHLTVASEAAEMALRQDSDRLKLDASLSAVRIAEVKVDRATQVSEPSRADTAGQQSHQHPSSGQGTAAWANNSQNMGQSPGQQGRWRAGENNGFNAKTQGDPAVLNHAEARQDASQSRRARYA